jgi:hypothetical protein
VSAWEPWANDPESFERACLAEVERELSYPGTAGLMREPAGRELRGVRLDGSYPETEIMVTYLDLIGNQVEEQRFPLWQEEIFRAQDGTMLGPDNIAQEIWTWLIEP